MANEPIESLFANDIHRWIEEVIKVDQTTDDILRDEINEYVVTDAIRSHYTNIFDAYRETPNKPHEGSLGLLRDEKGKTVFRVESGALAEVLTRIEERANYGDTASGRYLADELAKEPFGWDFEVVRLLVLSLCAPGKFRPPAKTRRSIPPRDSRPATRFRITISSAKHRSDRRRASSLRSW